MPILAALALFLWSTSAPAAPPPHLCRAERCTPRMQEIASRFEAATGFTETALPYLASGECYHLSRYYNPETTHYGLTLLDPREGSVFMGGVFAFFFPENPYKDWTVEKVREQDPRLYEKNRIVEMNRDYSFADMNPGGEDMWLYWLKRDANHLYLIGQWGTAQRLFCEFTPHRGAGE